MKDFLTRLAEQALGAVTPVQPLIPSLYSPSLSAPGLQATAENEGGIDALTEEKSLHFETSDNAEAREIGRGEDHSRRIGPSMRHGGKPLAKIPPLSGTSEERVSSPPSPHGQIRDRVMRNEPHAEDARQPPASQGLAGAGAAKRKLFPAAQRGPRSNPLQVWHKVESAAVEGVEGRAAESALHSLDGKTPTSYAPIVPVASAPRRYTPEESQVGEEASPHPSDQQSSAARREIRPATRFARGEPSAQIQTQSPIPRDSGLSPATEASTIQVSIGRIEVRAVRSSDPLPQRASLPAPRLSLEDFLKRHNENRR